MESPTWKEKKIMREAYEFEKQILPKMTNLSADVKRKIKGTTLITSKCSITTIFVLPEQLKDTKPISCCICGDAINIFTSDYEEWKNGEKFYCGKSSCDLAMNGDKCPIVTEDDIIHYCGMSLRYEEVQ